MGASTRYFAPSAEPQLVSDLLHGTTAPSRRTRSTRLAAAREEDAHEVQMSVIVASVDRGEPAADAVDGMGERPSMCRPRAFEAARLPRVSVSDSTYRRRPSA